MNNNDVKIATTLLLTLFLFCSGLFAGGLEIHTDHKDDSYHSQDLTVHVGANHSEETSSSKSEHDCPHIHFHAVAVAGLVENSGFQIGPFQIFLGQSFIFLDSFNLQDYSASVYRPPIYS
jgi:hypothetical protein